MFCFAYGSNLHLPYLHEYCPNATFVMRAELPNYRIEFRRYSTDMQGGISTIMPTPGHLVRGVIYDIPDADMAELDVLEDVPLGLYVRETYLVLDEHGAWQKADLYRVANPTGPYDPAPGYIEYMVEGAKMHGLDPDYIESLEALRPIS